MRLFKLNQTEMGTTYFKQLQRNAHIQLRWFRPMMKRALETGKGVTTERPIPLKALNRTLYFTPSVKADASGSLTLTMRWEDDGKPCGQRIQIVREESNLIAGSSVYYFLCPFGFKSRKLFFVGNAFRSRRSFAHTYGCQMKSRLQRSISCPADPRRAGGKRLYKGKLTPYGKRCQKYKEKKVKQAVAMMAYTERITEKLCRK